MPLPQGRSGRPRRYDFAPAPGCANRDAALAVSALDELSARLMDLLTDLPPEALRFVPEGGGNSIAMLALHMAAAEALWVSRLTGAALPEDLRETLALGLQDASGQLPPSAYNAATLAGACGEVREFTRAQLAPLHDLDHEVAAQPFPLDARGVLMHLIWHWTYHTGQVGLLRRLCGARYKWTFDKKLAGPAASG
jgi:uncharacterized damage-inducible protein DinB